MKVFALIASLLLFGISVTCLADMDSWTVQQLDLPLGVSPIDFSDDGSFIYTHEGQAWHYADLNILQVGLSSSTYLSQDNLQFNQDNPKHLYGEGRIVSGGAAFEFDDDPDIHRFYPGEAAWLWNGNETHKLGLYDPRHGGVGGLFTSIIIDVNDAGFATGFSNVYGTRPFSGDSIVEQLDATVWYFDGERNRGHRSIFAQ